MARCGIPVCASPHPSSFLLPRSLSLLHPSPSLTIPMASLTIHIFFDSCVAGTILSRTCFQCCCGCQGGKGQVKARVCVDYSFWVAITVLRSRQSAGKAGCLPGLKPSCTSPVQPPGHRILTCPCPSLCDAAVRVIRRISGADRAGRNLGLLGVDHPRRLYY